MPARKRQTRRFLPSAMLHSAISVPSNQGAINRCFSKDKPGISTFKNEFILSIYYRSIRYRYLEALPRRRIPQCRSSRPHPRHKSLNNPAGPRSGNGVTALTKRSKSSTFSGAHRRSACLSTACRPAPVLASHDAAFPHGMRFRWWSISRGTNHGDVLNAGGARSCSTPTAMHRVRPGKPWGQGKGCQKRHNLTY